MAKKHKNKTKWHEGINPETKQSVFAIFSFALALLFTLAAFGKAGLVGNGIQKFLELLFGRAVFLVPLVFFLGGFSFLFSIRQHFVLATSVGAVIFLLASLGLVDLVAEDTAAGYIGYAASFPFLRLLDFWGALIFLAAFALAGVLIMLNVPLRIWRKYEEGEEPKKSKREEIEVPVQIPLPAAPKEEKKEEEPDVDEEEEETEPPEQESASFLFPAKKQKKARSASAEILLPPLDLLEDDKGTPSSGDVKANANIIKRTLQNFGIEVEMSEVNIGPSVTQYTLKPAEGVKLAKITALQNDLALALAAHPLRIEAPIPGRSLVGVEVPNRSIALVGLRNLLSGDEFQKSALNLPLALGRDVSGRPVYTDLAKMPHLLIAGATGTGKSVAIHGILTSFLYKNSPEMLRFIIIDPKRVELAAYSKIPHLLTPVITDAKKAILSLKWAAKEMERRYEVLEAKGVRDIRSYHSNVIPKDEEAEGMPYLVVVIDELADIMATYPRELEASIVRLAQMSRAVGIHLVVSTQRPSVEVITGLIKANITSRIAFQVASQVDSRTILDTSGAERLLGNGDMLYLAGDVSRPRRIQGAFVSEKEVKRVTEWLASHLESEETEEKSDIFSPVGNGNANGMNFSELEASEDDDELYEEARALAIEAGKVSASYLQRRLRVGYARAARLLDLMEENGVIGPADGAKPREVLVKKQDFSGGAEVMEETDPETKSHEKRRERKSESGGGGDFYDSF